MLRPQRTGPWPYVDIETPPWVPGGTLIAAIDNVAHPLVGGGVRSVTAPSNTNYEHFSLDSQAFTTTQKTAFALGCLINGTNRESDLNTIYTVFGNCRINVDAADQQGWLCPIISKLDTTPSDPDALITITDYSILNVDQANNLSGVSIYASVNTQVLVGDVRGSTATQSDLPIFVGWMYVNSDSGNFTVGLMQGNIGVYKYNSDLIIEDNWRI